MNDKYFNNIAKLDTYRGKCRGIHEFIFAKIKKPEVANELLYKMAKINKFSVASKVSRWHMNFIHSNVRDGFTAELYEDACMWCLKRKVTN